MRTMHFVRHFRQFGPVDIAYTFGPAEPPPIGPLVRSALELSLEESDRFGRRLIIGMVAGGPTPVYRYDRASRAAFAAKVASERYDHVVLRSAYTSGLVADLDDATRARTILDLDDNVAGTLYDQLMAGEHGLRRFALELNRSLVRRHERRSAGAVTTTVCTEEDRSRLGRHSATPPFFVPNIYAPPAGGEGFDAGEGFALGDRLLFVGTLSYAPNAQGLRWFLDTIFPSFRDARPGATLVVVGRSPSTEVQASCEATEGVTLIADAPDVLSHYARARAVVVPLLAGGGTRIKILEAAFAQRPVLSTAIGAEGLGFNDGRELLLFEDAAGFVRSYDALGDDPTYRGLVSAAKAQCVTKYSVRGFNEAVSAVTAHMESVTNNNAS